MFARGRRWGYAQILSLSPNKSKPEVTPLQLTPRHLILQFAHVLQQELFPSLQASLGSLSADLERLAAVVALLPLQSLASGRSSHTGRPPKDRVALATAFIAKAVLNLATTRQLISRLRADDALRRLCGWNSAAALPHESKFSRAFEQFARTQLPQRLHSALIETTQRARLIGHIARDSTAIPVRERVSQAVKEQRAKDKKAKAKTKGQRKARTGHHPKAKASQRGTRLQRQQHQSLPTMLAELPQQCDYGAKQSSQGETQFWCGYKLHLDVADGQIPISAILTSASLHDSQVAIPLMRLTSQRVDYCYELMDSAYDADPIHAQSRKLNHVPIIAIHPRRGTKRPSALPKIAPPKPTPELSWAQQERYKTRTMSERVNARLKDEFGGRQVRVRGAAKVMAHLMFGVLALTMDQILRLIT